MSRQLDGVLDHLAEVYLVLLHFGGLGKLFKLPHDLGSLFSSFEYPSYLDLGRFVQVALLQDNVCIAHNGAQGVVQLVGHSGGQVADGLPLLGVEQLLLELLSLI